MKMYWTKVEEEECEKFRVASTPKEELQAYNRFITKLYIIARKIQNRYFYGCDLTIVDDAVNHCVLKIKQNYNPEKLSLYYSFCSVLIRNYIGNVVVVNSKYMNNIDLIDDIPWLVDKFPDSQISISETDEEIKQRILKRFKRFYAKTIQSYVVSEKYYEVVGKTTTKENLKKIDNYIKFMKSAINYIEIFGVQITMQGLVEYCQNENKFSDKVVDGCSIHFFLYAYKPKKSDSISKSKLINRNADNLMQVFINDDWTPIEDNKRCKYVIKKRLFLNKN
jgi:hypothetical protein